mmetsp:Transcript_30490/g.57713  ORF Transcript_30490/g.57713 Transcript_30490/m.57713 type:complete len:85 (-) Transcript_30490:593-847(-)
MPSIIPSLNSKENLTGSYRSASNEGEAIYLQEFRRSLDASLVLCHLDMVSLMARSCHISSTPAKRLTFIRAILTILLSKRIVPK